MAAINLLPIDLSPKRDVFKVAAFIKKVALILTGVILFASVLEVILIVFLIIQIRSSATRAVALKQNIASLQSTEQKLFLIKDRTTKISKVFATKNASTSFDTVNQILSALPADVTVDSLTVDTLNTKFSVLSRSSLGMAAFLNTLVLSESYKTMILKNFIFSPESGYLITLQSS